MLFIVYLNIDFDPTLSLSLFLKAGMSVQINMYMKRVSFYAALFFNNLLAKIWTAYTGGLVRIFEYARRVVSKSVAPS